jgi:hypothetical protein
MNARKIMNSGLLPFPVIEAAANGDACAINHVLKHYEGYIDALSTRRLCDENGMTYLALDDEMCRTLETKLIVKVMQFDTASAV